MKDNNINKLAKSVRRNLNGEINVSNIISYLYKIGYTVIFFNTPHGDELVKTYRLEKDAQQLKAFTYVNKVHFVFINNDLHNRDKLYSLLHELGHIVLGHLNGDNIFYSDKRLIDAEAETFVYEVMKPHKNKTALIIIIICLSAVLSFMGGLYAGRSCAPAADVSSANLRTDNVIITRTGKAFHRDGCISIKNKDCILIPRSEAEKIYAPCGICNP